MLSRFFVDQFLPMNILDPVQVLKYLGLTVVYLLAMRFCTRRVQSNEIDSFLVLNVSIAFTMTLLTLYLVKSEIRPDDFIHIAFLTATFYLTVLFLSIFLKFETLKAGVKTLARTALLEDGLRDPIIVSSFMVLAPITLFFASAISQSGEGSSADIIRGSSFLRLFGEGLSPFFAYYALSALIASGRVRNGVMLFFIFAAGPVLGSKAAIISTFVNFFMIRGLYKPEMRLKQALKWLPLLPVALATMTVPLLLTGRTIDVAALSLGARFFLSGDIYFWLFVAARPESFYAYYDWPTYLLHPFTALLGFRGYDLPLGAALMSHYLGYANLGGPNPHAPALGLVLFKGNLLLATLFCAVMGGAVVALRYGALRALAITTLPPFLRSAPFIICFQAAPMLFLDFGTTERLMLSTLIFAVLYFFLGVLAELGKRARSLPNVTERPRFA